MGKTGRDNAKAYEKVCPEWFTDSGRWWGIVGSRLGPEYAVFQLHTLSEWYNVKRLLRSYARSVTCGRYCPRSRAGEHGQTILAHGGDLVAYGQLIRWVTQQRLIVPGADLVLGSVAQDKCRCPPGT
jgi:hypothetical protein